MADTLWLVLALISAFTGGFIGIIGKYVLKKCDYVSYAFTWNIFNALLLLPLVFLNFSFPDTINAWILLSVGSLLWFGIAIAGFKSLQLVDVSLREPIVQIKVLLLLVLSTILISEVLTFSKVVGTILIFSSLFSLTYERGKLFSRLKSRGIQIALLSALLVALASVVDKTALGYWTIAPYLFLEFFIPGLMLGGMTFFRKKEFVEMMKSKYMYIILVTILGAASAYTLYWAYQLTEVSVVFPVVQLSTLITVIGGIILLKERKDMLLKILATIVMIAGVILISGYV